MYLNVRSNSLSSNTKENIRIPDPVIQYTRTPNPHIPLQCLAHYQ